MVKIYQGELPKTINVVVNRQVIETARFVNGVYETENKDVIAELKRYGYEVENIKEPVKEIKEPVKVKEEQETKPKPKAKTNKKKGAK